MSDPLLSCPFCGSNECELTEREKVGSVTRWHRVVCLACGTEGPETQGCGLNYFGADRIDKVAAEATVAWNTRHSDPDELREALEELRPYVERVSLGEGTMPEIVCAEARLNAIDELLARYDTALSRNVGDVG